MACSDNLSVILARGSSYGYYWCALLIELPGSITISHAAYSVLAMSIIQDFVYTAENEDFPSDAITLDFPCFIEGTTNCTTINTTDDQLLEGPEVFGITIEEDPNFLEALVLHNDVQVTINDQGNMEVYYSVFDQ